jgi:hypothetical protein
MGWRPAESLEPGQLLMTHDDRRVPVEEIEKLKDVAPVFNFRIADFHTYFVGSVEWGFTVWVHNQYTAISHGDGSFSIVDDAGNIVQRNVADTDVARALDALNAPQTLSIASSQLQKKFIHAANFGVSGSPNKQNLQAFENAIQAHVNSGATQAINGTYRGNAAIIHVDPQTGLAVITDTAGTFISGWRLSAQQLWHVLNGGKLGGG